MIRRSIDLRSLLCGPLAASLLFVSPGVEAQSRPMAHAYVSAGSGGGFRASDDLLRRSRAIANDRYVVVIDLDENLLHFRKGNLTLWSAPVGTGTGLRMKSDDKAWDFSTPNGAYQIKYKERNPDWIAPDWYFVENGLPIPPVGDAKRRFPGGLGAAAVFIENDLAIHGTDKPELLGQRVSHGCIRLANKDALRLFHNVQVGTEVLIVGGKDVPRVEVTAKELQKKAAATFDPAKPKPAPADPQVEKWRKLSTEALLSELDDQLWLGKATRWPEVTGLLIERGLEKGDDLALAGVMAAVLDLPSARIEREYKTFLAHAYARGSMRTLEVLSRLSRSHRDRVAAALVEGVMESYHGEFTDSGAPWPTRRVPQSLVKPDIRRGWQALREAEESFGTRIARASV